MPSVTVILVTGGQVTEIFARFGKKFGQYGEIFARFCEKNGQYGSTFTHFGEKLGDMVFCKAGEYQETPESTKCVKCPDGTTSGTILEDLERIECDCRRIE
jgi:hypothetical protein